MEPQELKPVRAFLWKLIVETFLLVAVFAGPAAFLGYFIGMDEGGIRTAMLGMSIPLGFGAVSFVIALPFLLFYYRSLRYVIHADEVVVEAGILTKSVKHVPYRTVTNLKVARGPFDRLFGIGTLAIQTAGMSGQTGAEESLVGLPDVTTVYEQVASSLRKFRGAMPATAGSDQISPEDGDLGAILREVRSIRHMMESG
ncbi:MAG: PH domain-containing protein [Anaerolineales bacterium]